MRLPNRVRARRLIAETSVDEFVARVEGVHARPRSPELEPLRPPLAAGQRPRVRAARTPCRRDARARGRLDRGGSRRDLELGHEREPNFFRTPEDVYATGLMFLAERCHRQLDTEDDLGVVVVDSRFREDDQRLRRFFAGLTKDGTPYMQLPRIVEGLFLGPSHYLVGLQCADLVVAMTANDERGGGQGRGY